MKLNRTKLRRLIRESILKEDFVQDFVGGIAKDIDKSLGRGPMSPRTLRIILRNFPNNVKSGFTAYAKHKPTGQEGILVFGLSGDDVKKQDILTNIKVLNQHHGPKKGIKSIAMYPGNQSGDFEIKGGSAAIRRIEDDEHFSSHSKESFEDYLKQLTSEVYLYKLK